MYRTETLDNGLRIVTSEMPHTRSAAVHIYVGVGARHEAPELAGISHFVEHMVFKGTQHRPNPVQISEAIEGVGGSLNACTDHEQTSYQALVPSTYLDVAVNVLTDMLRHPLNSSDEVEKERQVIIEELNATFDAPGEIAELLFDRMLWEPHPFGRDIAGTKQSVRRIRRRHLVEYMEQHYRPDHIVVSVAGNIEHDDVVRIVEREWGDARATATAQRGSPPAPITEAVGPHYLGYRKKTEQTNVILGVPALPYTHPARYTQDVLDTLLGGGMSSRLFVELRENLGLAYNVGSFVKSYSDAGAFGVHAAIDGAQLPQALRTTLVELERISSERPSDVELRKVKEYIKGHTLLSLERSGYVAHWGGWQESMMGKIEDVDEVLEKVESVTAEDVRDLAEQLFSADKLHLAVVGPNRDEETYLSLLKLGK